MKPRFALVAAFALCLTATASIVYQFPSMVTLTGSVRLTDGHVLAAGPYDVQIHYQGFGNSAEIWFFTGGVFKGKTNAEARGFPAQAPAGVTGGGQTGFLKIDGEATDKDHKVSADASAQKAAGDPAAGKVVAGNFPKTEGGAKVSPGASVESFSWGKAGFAPGIVGKTAPVGRSLKISFDSANSAAGFSALVPAVQK